VYEARPSIGTARGVPEDRNEFKKRAVQPRTNEPRYSCAKEERERGGGEGDAATE